MKAVILAGGLGTRLLPYTKSIPKPMLPLGKKPMLEHIIEWIKKNGVKDIVLCASYKHKKIKEYLNDSKYLEKVLIDGSQKASEIATKNLEEIYDIIGLKKFT